MLFRSPAPDLSPSAEHNGLDQSNLSYHAGLDYKLDGGALLYVSVSRGYKSGIISPIAASATSEYTPAKQERLDAYEVGFKAPFLDHRVHLNAAAFYYDYTDKQLRSRLVDPTFGLLETLVNVPKSDIWGVQTDLVAQPIQGLTLTASATYLDSDVTKSFNTFNEAGAFGDIEGSQLPNTPRVSIAADGQYERPITGALDAFFGSSLTYHSKTNSTFDTPSAPAPTFALKSYTILDLRAGIAASDGSWRLSVFAKNVTNTFYVLDVFNNVDTLYRDAGMPATYGISLNVKWR